jgi:hypothetical protein
MYRMSGAMVLTQFEAAMSPVAMARHALPGDGEQRMYQAIEPPHRAALLQYSIGEAPQIVTPPTISAPLLARYSCCELSDSGAVAEVAPVLMIVAFDVPPERAAMVERWYGEEHIPLLRRAPGWLRARRYAMQSWQGAPRYTSLALHELRSVQVLDSAERAYARATAWRAAMSSESWFVNAGRFVYERIK